MSANFPYPNTNSFHKMSGSFEEPNNTSSPTVPNLISQFYQPESNLQQFPVNITSVHESHNEPSHVTNKNISSSVTNERENREPNTSRKINSEGSSSMTSAQSKQKKRIGHVTKEKKVKDNKKEEKKAREEAPTGYVHVRARRGQATDSHSLAERVRREKISERMKILQALVPGCDKVTGKALMLDDIINYVQSLQNQVEFLSMKLASLNPMYYDFGMELDALMVGPDQLNALLFSFNYDQSSNTNSGYPRQDSSSLMYQQQFHLPNPISQ
ncbi:hypothetical protein K7X08_031782 [Anisodus acutangulus]|uniref:BHLH domain-containing protein n=1 Tax=Anisodus acutangulus TaxID=402998 RepID=A0A9Q1RMF9_9SOLA|nr:hypothetical protein K7X08_031782 [Anisodus acutangulus]